MSNDKWSGWQGGWVNCGERYEEHTREVDAERVKIQMSVYEVDWTDHDKVVGLFDGLRREMIEINRITFPACKMYPGLSYRQKAILYTSDFIHFFVRKYYSMIKMSCENPPGMRVPGYEVGEELSKERRRLADKFKEDWCMIYDKKRYIYGSR